MAKTLILCDCLGTNPLDSDALSQATGLPCSRVHTSLCQDQQQDAARALSDGDAIFCCGQETALFEEIADSLGVPYPAHLDLRDRAGWSVDTGSRIPKMTALVAEASLSIPAAKTVDVVSEGLCLILGAEEPALLAAEQLQTYLSVTVLLESDATAPFTRDYDVVQGRLKSVNGALGNFDVTIDGFCQMLPHGAGQWAFTSPKNGAKSKCDIILDLRGAPPLFPAPEKREGYFRADPNSATAVARAVLDASHMVGTFEKPLYVRTEPLLCAHSRAEQTGCTRCIDACPTGAITSSGEHVSVDPMICAGCGACSSLCPSGAIAYDAPTVDQTIRRVQTLAKAYLDAGGVEPRLLIIGADGAELIRVSARFGQGLPANVIPLEVEALNTIGHSEMLAALAAGFADINIHLPPKTDRDVMQSEIDLATALSSKAIRMIETQDPDILSETLFAPSSADALKIPARPMGTRRQIARTATKALQPDAEILPLPQGAPYGAVLVDTDACTLCLSCISLCPSGALGDNPDLPQLRFQEDACLQCGLCARVCPENAITYEPRMNLTNSALEQVVLNEEEPFACIECGALFGVKSTIDKITEKLAGKHGMFQSPEAARMIQMCDNCRVSAQYHAQNNPFAGGERPKPRTTDDYLSKRRDH
ncbi:4Fe-4S binding protein [Shimia sp. W99]